MQPLRPQPPDAVPDTLSASHQWEASNSPGKNGFKCFLSVASDTRDALCIRASVPDILWSLLASLCVDRHMLWHAANCSAALLFYILPLLLQTPLPPSLLFLYAPVPLNSLSASVSFLSPPLPSCACVCECDSVMWWIFLAANHRETRGNVQPLPLALLPALFPVFLSLAHSVLSFCPIRKKCWKWDFLISNLRLSWDCSKMRLPLLDNSDIKWRTNGGKTISCCFFKLSTLCSECLSWEKSISSSFSRDLKHGSHFTQIDQNRLLKSATRSCKLQFHLQCFLHNYFKFRFSVAQLECWI